jgi:general secretion pathway protein K
MTAKSPHPALQRRRRRAAESRRGVALVMVLGAIVVLTVFLTQVQEDSSSGLAAALADRDALRAEYHARSAINLSRLLVGTEPTVRRAVAPILMMINPKGKPPQIPVWAFSDQVLGLFNDSSGAESFQALSGVDTATATNVGLGSDGHFTVAIIDEDSKINVNVAARGDVISEMRIAGQLMGLLAPIQYNPMFENPDPDGQYSDRATICGALIDWADYDETANPCDVMSQGPVSTGSEDNYYQTIGLPYLRKNAAYDSLEEMRLVRGISDEFWATFVDPSPDKPDKRVLTVWGQGKVNVNTANALTLLAVVCSGAPDAELCIDPVQAQAFVMAVTLARSFTAGAPLFGSAQDFLSMMKGAGMVGPLLEGLGVKPVQFRSESEMKKVISTESKMFSIYADGVIPGSRQETHVRIHAVVDFRQSQDLPSLIYDTGQGTDGSGTNPPVQAPGVQQPAGGAKITGPQQELTAEQMAAALTTNPLGQVVYWRIE